MIMFIKEFILIAVFLAVFQNVECSIEAIAREKVNSANDEINVLKAAKENCAYGTVPYEYSKANGSSTTMCDVCGESFFTPNPRIVGGTEAVSGSWPAQVYIRQAIVVNVQINNRFREISQTFVCGGTIVNRYTILTAAHCITTEFDAVIDGKEYIITLKNPFDPSMYTVYVGAHDLTYLRTAPTVKMDVRKVVRHPSYSSATFINDIALYLLSQPIEFNKFVQPACLPDPAYGTYPASNTPVYASGWGTTREGGSTSMKLLNIKLTHYTPDKCTNVNSRFTKNWLSQLCAGEVNGGKDTCQGDSGGGLYTYEATSKRYVVAGITSYGEGCAKVGKPGVYTRTSYYIAWIKANWSTSANSASMLAKSSLLGLLNSILFFKLSSVFIQGL